MAITQVDLIGAPTDVGASIRGASMGPEALRVANLPPALERQGMRVADAGNLAGPTNPWHPPRDGFRHLEEVAHWNRAVHEAVLGSLQAGHFPILMGGDHCLAIGSISAVAQYCRAAGRKLIVLWLDAHADANTHDITPTGNIHGMPVACLCGQGPDALTRLSDAYPAVDASAIRQVGIRSVDAEEKRQLRALGLRVFDMRHIDENGMRLTMEQALAEVDENTHLHVSFDADFLDSVVAPGVGTPVLGGPTYREAQLCMEMIADTGRLSSLDLMELNPACDVRNQTAEVVVDLVESLFGKSTLIRR
ncbi:MULTISPECIES: arginase [unclassified Achromobacter]|uniref:arginase n=1 Tax=unclassified Achromobacter TaxID=2626865 RepID=UPI000B51A2EF|nr:MULTISPECIES: arginase [unclassified Achromobacter]OWT80571.1 arginase [Achromobacter sp. HZ34]OWT82454.1 arginase [Achromobacter sp. HZ28]